MAKQLFTSETAKVAQTKSVSTKRAALKVQKYLAKLGIEKEYIEAFLKGMASPVVAGTSMYLLVLGIEKLTNSYYAANQTGAQHSANQAAQNLLQMISQALPPGLSQAFSFGSQVGTASASGNPFALDLIALKTAIIIYITTGGNLSGLLGTATNLFTSLAK